MIHTASEKIKTALEARWVEAGAQRNATESVLNDMDTKQSTGLLIEACDLLRDWIDMSANGPTDDETEALNLAKEALR